MKDIIQHATDSPAWYQNSKTRFFHDRTKHIASHYSSRGCKFAFTIKSTFTVRGDVRVEVNSTICKAVITLSFPGTARRQRLGPGVLWAVASLYS